MIWFIPENHTKAISRQVFDRVLRSDNYLKKQESALNKFCATLYSFSHSLFKKKLRELSDKELGFVFKQHLLNVRKVYGCGLTSTMVEFPETFFTNHVLNLLKSKAQKINK